MEKIEFLTAQDSDAVEQMKTIWRECFGTQDDYLNVYFPVRYRPEETMVYRDEDKVLGMLTLMPCSYRLNGKVLRAAYIFALATLPKAQGKNVATKMLKKVDEVLMERGADACILCPGTEELYRFYSKRGYREAFTRRIVSCPPAGEQAEAGIFLKELSQKEYFARHQKLRPENSVLWEEDVMAFVEAESKLCHGGIYELMEGEKPMALVNIFRDKDDVIAKEFLTEEGVKEQDAAEALRKLFPDSTVHFRFPGTKESGSVEAEAHRAGMVRFYTEGLQEERLSYLPFILD